MSRSMPSVDSSYGGDGDDPGGAPFMAFGDDDTTESEGSETMALPFLPLGPSSDSGTRVAETEEDDGENLVSKGLQRERSFLGRGNVRIRSKESDDGLETLARSPRKSEPLGLLNGIERKALRSNSRAQEKVVRLSSESYTAAKQVDACSFKSGTTLVDVNLASVKSVCLEESEVVEQTATNDIIDVIDDQKPCSSQQALASWHKEDEAKANSVAIKSPVHRPCSSTEGSEDADATTEDEDEYEVEEIIGYTRNAHGEKYLIKWKGWPSDANTWEPPENLNDCFEKKWNFYCLRKACVYNATLPEFVSCDNESGVKRRKLTTNEIQIPPDPRPLDERMKDFFNSYRGVSEDEILAALVKSKKPKKISRWNSKTLEKTLDAANEGHLPDENKESLRDQLIYWLVEDRIRKQQTDLKNWETSINKITDGMPKISVLNSVDLASYPAEFTYVNDYVPRDGIIIPDDPPVGCACEGSLCFANKKTCCSSLFGVPFAYSQKKKLRVSPGTPIYECNKKCDCGPDCPNRVVQDGVTPLKGMSMSIYRTSNGCGWGLKTLKPVKKGTFVCMYVGEVINTEEAERRGKEYDEEGCTYLFDLDFNEDEKNECLYTIDAAKCGNFSHFMNHSCDPNLTVFAVWVNCLDPNLPKLALFANRDIARDEDLTFDYKSHKTVNESGTTEEKELPLIKRKPCLCGASNCRKILF